MAGTSVQCVTVDVNRKCIEATTAQWQAGFRSIQYAVQYLLPLDKRFVPLPRISVLFIVCPLLYLQTSKVRF
jgi:hypothetical protein